MPTARTHNCEVGGFPPLHGRRRLLSSKSTTTAKVKVALSFFFTHAMAGVRIVFPRLLESLNSSPSNPETAV